MYLISADGFRALLENVPDGFFVHDETGRLLDLSERCCVDLGYAREDLLEMSILDISRGVARDANLEKWRQASPGDAMSYRDVAVRKDGSTFPVEIRLTCQIVDGRKLFLGVALDVVEQAAGAGDDDASALPVEERTAELRAAHERLAIATAVGGLGIWDYDIVRDELHCDPQWHRLMGRDPDRPIRNIAEFRAIIHPDDAERATEVQITAAKLVAEQRDYGIDFRVNRPDGETRWIRSVACVVEDEQGAPSRAVGYVVDVTEARLAEAMLKRQTLEDPLTGLANRRRLDEELTRAFLHATRTGEPVSMAIIDVDHFKPYNDRQGHMLGDKALQAIADILKTAARRPYDLAVRYGGDEFVLLLPGTDEPGTLLGRIRDELAALAIVHPTAPTGPHMTVSCGCVIASEPADVAPADMLAECDRALYRAKEAGRNRVEIARL